MRIFSQKFIEQHAVLLLILTLLTISIGGIVEIVPLFTIETTIERVKGVRPYSPLELAGRDIYVREGCYLCHSQQIRPFRDEVERYGHYSLAAESMYDHPFLWGSERQGPDLIAHPRALPSAHGADVLRGNSSGSRTANSTPRRAGSIALISTRRFSSRHSSERSTQTGRVPTVLTTSMRLGSTPAATSAARTACMRLSARRLACASTSRDSR